MLPLQERMSFHHDRRKPLDRANRNFSFLLQQWKTRYYQAQTRSADEPMTVRFNTLCFFV